ncbi:hypothetical protein GCK72_009323 [Caenorhabditis remanei]|uniref:Thiolase C-terminal domain-containing protein n=1 Tax=Caenorhabditis remanei TaxID=31234 RepID=A0A6A5H271_CAERE|nr:hypothetical protein GCK72_009323 [Caenorhabditis remanei]KAF1761069.1 hypothetical protein GCK72_009323 [Caenorhabditis remanei]
MQLSVRIFQRGRRDWIFFGTSQPTSFQNFSPKLDSVSKILMYSKSFAGQVLANLNAMDSEYFCKEQMKRSGKFRRLPMDKLNLWGGSLSIGHPYTGVRLAKEKER